MQLLMMMLLLSLTRIRKRLIILKIIQSGWCLLASWQKELSNTASWTVGPTVPLDVHGSLY